MRKSESRQFLPTGPNVTRPQEGLVTAKLVVSRIDCLDIRLGRSRSPREITASLAGPIGILGREGSRIAAMHSRDGTGTRRQGAAAFTRCCGPKIFLSLT